MRGGLRGSVGVSAPYDRVAGLVGHSHAMTEWTMLGQETPPRVCVWPGRLHLRRSVKAAAYPKKNIDTSPGPLKPVCTYFILFMYAYNVQLQYLG